MNFFRAKAMRQRGIGEIDSFRFLPYEQNPRHSRFSIQRIISIRRSPDRLFGRTSTGERPFCFLVVRPITAEATKASSAFGVVVSCADPPLPQMYPEQRTCQ